jgi:hypothetical protein
VPSLGEFLGHERKLDGGVCTPFFEGTGMWASSVRVTNAFLPKFVAAACSTAFAFITGCKNSFPLRTAASAPMLWDSLMHLQWAALVASGLIKSTRGINLMQARMLGSREFLQRRGRSFSASWECYYQNFTNPDWVDPIRLLRLPIDWIRDHLRVFNSRLVEPRWEVLVNAL